MIKAKVIKPFTLYYDANKEVYLDKNQFDYLKNLGFVIDTKGNKKKIQVETTALYADNKKIADVKIINTKK